MVGSPEAQQGAQSGQNTRYHSDSDADRTSHVDITYGSSGSGSDKDQTYATGSSSDPKPGNR